MFADIDGGGGYLKPEAGIMTLTHRTRPIILVYTGMTIAGIRTASSSHSMVGWLEY